MFFLSSVFALPSMATASGVVWKLYEETFTVKEKDPDGKKFDKGERWSSKVTCCSSSQGHKMIPRMCICSFALQMLRQSRR